VDDILIEEVVNSYKNGLKTIGNLKNKSISAICSKTGNVLMSWTAYKCIYGEISLGGNAYTIHNGKWYEINNDYVEKINSDYDDTPISSISFDECPKKYTENQYNNLFVSNHSTNYICMDNKLIRYGGGRSSIEFCDILSLDNKIIHVKKYAGSSALSHLFNQAFVSAQLIKYDDFIDKVNSKITSITSESSYFVDQSKKYEIVIAIICNDEDKPNIPFFSKITFSNLKRRLKVLDYKYSIKSILKKD